MVGHEWPAFSQIADLRVIHPARQAADQASIRRSAPLPVLARDPAALAWVPPALRRSAAGGEHLFGVALQRAPSRMTFESAAGRRTVRVVLNASSPFASNAIEYICAAGDEGHRIGDAAIQSSISGVIDDRDAKWRPRDSTRLVTNWATSPALIRASC
jgi:hypothetical protein